MIKEQFQKQLKRNVRIKLKQSYRRRRNEQPASRGLRKKTKVEEAQVTHKSL